MNQQERCLWLIKALLKEMPQYADTPFPHYRMAVGVCSAA